MAGMAVRRTIVWTELVPATSPLASYIDEPLHLEISTAWSIGTSLPAATQFKNRRALLLPKEEAVSSVKSSRRREHGIHSLSLLHAAVIVWRIAMRSLSPRSGAVTWVLANLTSAPSNP